MGQDGLKTSSNLEAFAVKHTHLHNPCDTHLAVCTRTAETDFSQLLLDLGCLFGSSCRSITFIMTSIFRFTERPRQTTTPKQPYAAIKVVLDAAPVPKAIRCFREPISLTVNAFHLPFILSPYGLHGMLAFP